MPTCTQSHVHAQTTYIDTYIHGYARHIWLAGPLGGCLAGWSLVSGRLASCLWFGLLGVVLWAAGLWASGWLVSGLCLWLAGLWSLRLWLAGLWLAGPLSVWSLVSEPWLTDIWLAGALGGLSLESPGDGVCLSGLFQRFGADRRRFGSE